MQFRDLKAQYNHLKSEIDAEIQEVINSSGFILGKKVTELEEKLAAYVGRKYCVSCGNGTDALQLVLMAWGIGPGDAVFTSDFTYFASAGTSSILGASVVFVDIDKRTFNLDPEHLEKMIEKTIAEGKLTPRVIVPVDLFGLPADYEKIEAIAKKYNMLILEDGAQGFGGNINGKKACSFGDASTTSFFPAKPLGCYGDGGAIFTDDEEMDKMLRSLRVQGRSVVDKYDNQRIGINSRLDTLQAAVLLPKFKCFTEVELDLVNHVADRYTERLSEKLLTPIVPKGFYSSWAQYTVYIESTEKRKEIQEKLKQKGIPTMVYYPRGLHQQSAYSDFNLSDNDYPNTVYATNHVLSLPMHPYLTDEEIDFICDSLLELL